MTLTISQKGMALVLVPLLFQLAFSALVVRLQRESREAEFWAAHAQQVIARVQDLLAALADAQAGAQGSAIATERDFSESFDRAGHTVPGVLDRLDELVADNPAQADRLRAIRAQAGVVLAWYGEVVALARNQGPDAARARLRGGDGNRLTEALRGEVGEFLAEEERLAGLRGDTLAGARRERNLLLAVGGVVAVVCSLAVAYLYQRYIGRRFAALAETTRRLAAGQDPPPPLAGDDELARLDRAFRDTAAALTRTSDELRDLYDNAPCGYHSIAPDGVVVAANRTELRWLGYDTAEVVGRMRFAELVSPASRDAYDAALERVKADGGATDVEIDLVRRDGTTFPVLLNSCAIRDPAGRFLRSRTTLADLTERKRAEAAIRRLNRELEDRVRARTAELEQANRELEHKNAENEMFVYSVSHDLRSPLVNLQGFSRELEKGCGGLAALLDEPDVPPAVVTRGKALLDGKMATSVGFIRTAVGRLGAIIDALLRLSRVGRVEYRHEVVDLAGVVREVVAAAQATITEKGAAVRVGELPPAWGDRTALGQLFANLIGNALAYLDPARPGVIEVGCLPPDAANAPDGFRAYYVRDNGLGIPEAHRARIFQPFQRAHPGVGTGEGLGLAIVARVAERHRGKVWVESTPGVGSTFYVTLPVPPGSG